MQSSPGAGFTALLLGLSVRSFGIPVQNASVGDTLTAGYCQDIASGSAFSWDTTAAAGDVLLRFPPTVLDRILYLRPFFLYAQKKRSDQKKNLSRICTLAHFQKF